MKKRFFSLLCAITLLLAIFPSSYADEGEEGEEGPVAPMEETTSPPAPEATPVETPESETGSDPEATPDPEPTSDPEIELEPEPILPQGTVVQVGLFYGSGAMDGANLENSVGTGYRLGYMDDDRAFHPLGYIGESMVSVVKSANVWYGTYDGYTCYFDNITSGIMVGCWHVLIPAEVRSFAGAQAFIDGAEGYFPAWIDGEWQVRYGSYADEASAQAAAEAMGGTAVGNSGYGVSVVRRGTSQILFQFDGGRQWSLTVNPGLDDSVRNVTWLKQNRYYGMFQYRRLTSGGDLTISNFLPLDDYAECVTSREMSASWPIEALKAQVICARNYYEQTLAKHKHRSQGFDICNTTCCQVYFGMASTSARTAQAAAETSELRIWYQGKKAEIYYYGSNGGATEACKNVWLDDQPYLIGQFDPYEADVADKIYHYSWTVTYTAQEIKERLHKAAYTNCADIVDFQVTARTEVGNVRSIVFIDSNGRSWPFVKDSARTILGLRSLRYTVTSSRAAVTNCYAVSGEETLDSLDGAYVIGGDGTVSQISGQPYVITSSGVEQLSETTTAAPASSEELVFTITGTGTGHHVGMSQWGAYAMAQRGMTYLDILTFYFPGVEIY